MPDPQRAQDRDEAFAKMLTRAQQDALEDPNNKTHELLETLIEEVRGVRKELQLLRWLPDDIARVIRTDGANMAGRIVDG